MVADRVTDDRRAIAFCASRSLTERVAAAVARALPPERSDTVASHRSGHLASERREIEDELAEGRIRAVAATSALELGVDIGVSMPPCCVVSRADRVVDIEHLPKPFCFVEERAC